MSFWPGTELIRQSGLERAVDEEEVIHAIKCSIQKKISWVAGQMFDSSYFAVSDFNCVMNLLAAFVNPCLHSSLFTTNFQMQF